MEKHPNLPWSVYLGAAGMPGGTGIFDLMHLDFDWGEAQHSRAPLIYPRSLLNGRRAVQQSRTNFVVHIKSKLKV
jgi:hypothetical protein